MAVLAQVLTQIISGVSLKPGKPVALPEGIGHTAVFGAAEDGSELWGDDGRRIWHAVRCAR